MRPQHLLEQIAVRAVALDVADEGLERERPAALEDEAVGGGVVGRERRDPEAADAGRGLGKAGVDQARAQMGRERRRRRQRHGRPERSARVTDRPGRRRRQPEAREQGVEEQLVVGQQPPALRIAPADDPVLDRPAEERPLVGRGEAPVVVEAEGVVLVGPELAGAEAQAPEVAKLRPGALAVSAGGQLQAPWQVERGVPPDVLDDLDRRRHGRSRSPGPERPISRTAVKRP